MAAADAQPTVIDGQISRKASNSLRLTFRQGGGDEPLAVATQGSGDGRGARIGILFGFKNGGPGRHGLVYPDGREIVVQSREQQPTLISDSSGTETAHIDRVGEGSDLSIAVTAGGAEILRFTSDPAEPETSELFRVVVTDATGADLGRLHVIRRAGGWKTLSDVLDSAWSTYLWWDRPGQSLPVMVLGTRLILLREVTPLERDVLLAACVDVAIGLRPYIPEMN